MESTYASFGSGMGLGDIAMTEAGHVEVAHAEIDYYANFLKEEYFKRHYKQPEEKGKNYGCIRKIAEDPTVLPNFRILLSGFPCPAFSVAGRRTENPFDQVSAGGDIFHHLCKIIEVKQPEILLFENVKGLLSAGRWKGEVFSTILERLSELRYDAQWQVLNTKNFGLPQNRERIFIVGHSRNKPRPEVFPLSEGDREDTRRVGEDLSYCLDANYWKGTNTLKKNRRQLIRINNPVHSTHRVYDSKGISPALTTMGGGGRQPYILTEVRSEEAKKIRREIKAETGKDHSPRRKKDIVPRKDGLVGSLTTSPTIEQTLVDGARVRRLTPLECMRLQGASDDMYFLAKELKISDTQIYKMTGNAVSIPVVRTIARRLHDFCSK